MGERCCCSLVMMIALVDFCDLQTDQNIALLFFTPTNISVARSEVDPWCQVENR